MVKRTGYPSAEQFRLQIAPYVLREVGELRRVICGTHFPLNTDEWKAERTFIQHIDEFVGAICGYPKIFHGQGSTPVRPSSRPPDAGSEEWWRRRIGEARRP